MQKEITISDILKTVSLTLAGEGFPDADREALYMAAHILGCKLSEVSLNRDKPVDEGMVDKLARFIDRRIKREPLQYILGETEFMGLPFKVTGDVLIPRPETEILVEEVLKIEGAGRILDLCTGSGCIAVSLAKLYKGADIVAIDVSHKALQVAHENAELNGIDSIEFLEVDFVKVVHSHRNEQGNEEGDAFRHSFDIIVSNPPYVSLEDFETLDPEVKVFEPRIALVADDDGYSFINEIIIGAILYLKAGGTLIMEVGYNQAETVASNLLQNGSYYDVEIIKDLEGIDRIVKARVI